MKPSGDWIDRPKPRLHGGVWPRTLAIVAIALILAWTLVAIFKQVVGLPERLIDKGGKTLVSVAEAFQRGRITHTFISYATTVTGASYLQFATLKQMEIFQRKDEAMTLGIPLPDVIVEARAPVEFTYYLDLKGMWRIALQDRKVCVLAPPIQFNKPAVDASLIQYEVRKGSIFRRTGPVMEALKERITAETIRRANEHIPLVREEGRKQTAAFIKTWLLREFPDGGNYEVQVIFPGEPILQSPPPLQSNPDGKG